LFERLLSSTAPTGTVVSMGVLRVPITRVPITGVPILVAVVRGTQFKGSATHIRLGSVYTSFPVLVREPEYSCIHWRFRDFLIFYYQPNPI
jgi:hypothetical protein